MSRTHNLHEIYLKPKYTSMLKIQWKHAVKKQSNGIGGSSFIVNSTKMHNRFAIKYTRLLNPWLIKLHLICCIKIETRRMIWTTCNDNRMIFYKRIQTHAAFQRSRHERWIWKLGTFKLRASGQIKAIDRVLML